jgi:hypothetical protein
MAKCIEKNDLFSQPWMPKFISTCNGTTILSTLGMSIPYRFFRLVAPEIFKVKLGRYTSLPSALGEVWGGSAEPFLRGVGRIANPAWLAYGIGMTGIETACAIQCGSDPNSFNW